MCVFNDFRVSRTFSKPLARFLLPLAHFSRFRGCSHVLCDFRVFRAFSGPLARFSWPLARFRVIFSRFRVISRSLSFFVVFVIFALFVFTFGVSVFCAIFFKDVRVFSCLLCNIHAFFVNFVIFLVFRVVLIIFHFHVFHGHSAFFHGQSRAFSRYQFLGIGAHDKMVKLEKNTICV